MEIYEKYIKGKSYEELIEIRQGSVPGGDVYEQATQEINRIQQDTNNTQIANLIGEIKTLKNITKENAEISTKNTRSANKIAKWAFALGAVSTVIAVMEFKTHVGLPDQCNYLYDSQTGHPSHKKCLYSIELGAHSYSWEDQDYQVLKAGEYGP